MTTAWANVVRGRLPSALAANVGGTLLAGMALVAGPWSLLAAIRGRPVGRLPSDRVLVAAAVTLMAITVLDWTLRLWNGI